MSHETNRFCHARGTDKQAVSDTTGDAMKTFDEWCQHYGYDPASAEALADHKRFMEQLLLFQRLLEEPDLIEGDDLPNLPNVPYAGRA